MSQEKVEKYKEEKAKRKSILKKQKVMKIVRRSAAVLAFLLVIVYVGGSGIKYYQDNKPRKAVEVDFAALNEYVDGLIAE